MLFFLAISCFVRWGIATQRSISEFGGIDESRLPFKKRNHMRFEPIPIAAEHPFVTQVGLDDGSGFGQPLRITEDDSGISTLSNTQQESMVREPSSGYFFRWMISNWDWSVPIDEIIDGLTSSIRTRYPGSRINHEAIAAKVNKLTSAVWYPVNLGAYLLANPTATMERRMARVPPGDTERWRIQILAWIHYSHLGLVIKDDRLFFSVRALRAIWTDRLNQQRRNSPFRVPSISEWVTYATPTSSAHSLSLRLPAAQPDDRLL